ncbi:hypothetical protein ACW185_05815 [Limosilactobacillus fermentum]
MFNYEMVLQEPLLHLQEGGHDDTGKGARFKQATQAIDQGQFGEGIRLLQELDLEVDDFAVNRA